MSELNDLVGRMSNGVVVWLLVGLVVCLLIIIVLNAKNASKRRDAEAQLAETKASFRVLDTTRHSESAILQQATESFNSGLSEIQRISQDKTELESVVEDTECLQMAYDEGREFILASSHLPITGKQLALAVYSFIASSADGLTKIDCIILAQLLVLSGWSYADPEDHNLRQIEANFWTNLKEFFEEDIDWIDNLYRHLQLLKDSADADPLAVHATNGLNV